MSRISVPTTARLPSTLRVEPSNPTVIKILNRLSRPSLISLALEWLDENHLPLAVPYLRDDEDDGQDENDFYPPETSPGALQEEYRSLQARKGSKREIIDRITTGDWRHGLTLYQLAMADLQYLYDHPTSQKWSAYRIVPLKPASDPEGDENPQEVDRTSLVVPPFHPSVFLKSLQTQILPDIKAHYQFDRHKTLALMILRIFILDSPYSTNLSLSSSFDSSRTFYIAFPDASPHVYLSRPQTVGAASAAASSGGEAKSLRNLIVEGIPKALSRPRQRFALTSTSLTTRNLEEMLERRGSARTNSAGGGWSVYADEKVKESPLQTVLPSPPLSEDGVGKEGGKRRRGKEEAGLITQAERKVEQAMKRARLVAKARFGETAKVGDGKGVERVDLVLEDKFPDFSDDEDEAAGEGNREGRLRRREPGGPSVRGGGVEMDLDRMDVDEQDDQREMDAVGSDWRPFVRLTFHGSHVFAGIRQLVECGVIDGEKMPGWMTGEEGVTMGAVRNGRIRGHKGSGL
ncbi:centromere protein Chl4/mis15/CENP-N [Cladorrhinum samala]|uniref:Centromere protein Chl4/mis15/CENP-N n=1 Tax=Cladorrhinum samala TaxID=585594 RepID=A0AAV9HK69_9PEZI|nr:centromere protein Chl4/mis15/CENP-N [Cladorrhinum samala]